MVEQTKTKPQETLEFKMKKQMQTFSCSPPSNLIEEGNWLLAVSFFEAANCFNIVHQNNSFSISTPGHWNSKNGQDLFNELKNY